MVATDRARRRGGEHGASALEYVAVLTLVALLAGAVLMAIPDVRSRVFDAVREAVCVILGGEDCGQEAADGDNPDGEGRDEEDEGPDPDDPCGLNSGPGGSTDDDATGPEPWEEELQRQQGQEDASDLAAILGDESGLGRSAGFVVEIGDPHFDISPVEIEHLADSYDDLVDFFAANADRLDDEAYAAALANELGPEGVRNLVDRVNTYGLVDGVDGTSSERDPNAVHRDYVEPLAALLGAADRSGQLDPEVQAAMVDTSPPSAEEIVANLDPDIYTAEQIEAMEAGDINEDVYQRVAWELQVQRQRGNAVLLDAGDFSSRTTADMADEILNGPHSKLDAIGLVEGFGTPEFFEEGDHHPSLADNRWVALQALADDPNAATLFYENEDNLATGELWTSDDNYDHDMIFLLMTEWRLDMSTDDVTDAMQDTARNSLDARCV